MDIQYAYRGTLFLWDEDKAIQNARKHCGITFHVAAEVFYDPNLVFVDASQNGEDRDAIIGLDTRMRMMFVVHLMIENTGIRIISARFATKNEVLQYDFQ